MTGGADGIYRLDNKPAKKQKDILNAFGMDAAWIKKETEGLQRCLRTRARRHENPLPGIILGFQLNFLRKLR